MILMIALVIGFMVLLAVMWSRVPRRGWLRWPIRVLLIVLCQLMACALAGVALNDVDRFYNTWSEVLGRHQQVLKATAPDSARVAEDLRRQLARRRAGRSAIVSIQVPEAGSARTHTAMVYLPAAYFDPARASQQFPVVEVLDGYPGSPQTWLGPMHLQRSADAEISAGRALPFLAVMPVQNYLPQGRDGQCLDVPHGDQVESTLTSQVRRTVLGYFRVSAERSAWALMGYSTGGYCALKIALRFPQYYASAASILGNTSPYHDADTGPAFKANPGLWNANDPVWLVANRTPPDLSILLATSHGDPATLRDARAFERQAREPLRVQLTSDATGGHNFHTFRLYEAMAFDWLSGRLRAPLAPAATVTDTASGGSPHHR
jgi:S-formylglutathione hydrolase FrmB